MRLFSLLHKTPPLSRFFFIRIKPCLGFELSCDIKELCFTCNISHLILQKNDIPKCVIFLDIISQIEIVVSSLLHEIIFLQSFLRLERYFDVFSFKRLVMRAMVVKILQVKCSKQHRTLSIWMKTTCYQVLLSTPSKKVGQ